MNAAERLLSVGGDDTVALECGNRRIRYGELRAAVARAAGAWTGLGVGPGTRVIVFAPDSIDWVIAYLGAIRAGGVAIGVNPRLSAADLAQIVADSEVRLLWGTAETASVLRAAADAVPGSPTVVSTGSGVGVDWNDTMAAAAAIEACARERQDPALWIGTSGTTGIPKGVIHTQRAAVQPHSFAERILGLSGADRLYSTSKLFFAYALANSLFAGLRLGATVILDGERPTPGHVQAMVERYRPTVLFTVPTLYSRILREGVAPSLANCGIRRFVSAGEALPAVVRQEWLAATGAAPISGYGTSETLCLVLYCDDASGLLRPTPLTSVRYDESVDAAAPQRIWVRNPTLAAGYWNRPDAQADGFRDGWFSPGDMFLRRDEGRLEFAGRTDDMLKVSGQWVSTLWIEHALMDACGAAVEQIAAVGAPTPDGLTGIAVLAVASAGRDNDARRSLAAGIERLPHHRRPHWVHWVRELPLTATGKVQRSRLRQAHEAALSGKAVA